ncbi:MAG: ech hydrogenase subunit [Desulfovibrionales bacterium]|nr:ech hydrogenase subunit [Desulfovibrionales bacterium]
MECLSAARGIAASQRPVWETGSSRSYPVNNVSDITLDALVAEVLKKKNDGWRFVTLSCTELDEESCDILYHFDKDLASSHFRLKAPKATPIPSISSVYFSAFLVENEIQDQFNLKFDGLAVDFERTLLLDEEVTTTPFCRYGVSRANQ